MNCHLQNANGNDSLPNGYFVKPQYREIARQQVWTAVRQCGVQRAALCVWPAERDVEPSFTTRERELLDLMKLDPRMPWSNLAAFYASNDNTPWLHTPLLAGELDQIRWLLSAFPVNWRLKLGFLWEALGWMKEVRPGIVHPDHPYANADNATAAQLQVLADLLTALPHDMQYRMPDVEYDLWIEFDPLGQEWAGVPAGLAPQVDMLAGYWPSAIEAMKGTNRRYTVSTIIDTEGRPERAIAAYRWLRDNAPGKTLPPPEQFFLDVHWNFGPSTEVSEASAVVVAEANTVFRALRREFPGYEISVGEQDFVRNNKAQAELFACGPKDVIEWL